RVRPVLDPAVAAEERVEEMRDVACCKDARQIRTGVLVDRDPVARDEAASLEERDRRHDADPDHCEPRAEHPAGVELDGVELRASEEGAHLVPTDHLDAAVSVK